MTVRLGIVGGGNISETHARAAQEIPGVEIVAFYGHNPARTARLQQQYGGTQYDDYAAFLQHQPMDLVVIGSPSGVHGAQGIAAARQGLHVLVEKPIEITTERADELIQVCAQAGVKLGVLFQDRVTPGIVQLKELVDTGTLGRPILATAHVKWFRPPEYYGTSHWRGTWALDGGGALMNQGVHTVDLLLWLMGPVTRVYAQTRTALHQIEVEDTVVATLEFANGAIGTIEATTSAYPGYKRRVELTGTEGTIILEHDKIVAADLRTRPATLEIAGESNLNASASSPVVSDVRGHRKLIEDFIEAIKADRAPRCSGVEARRSVELVRAIYQSAQTGQPVTLS